jgi:magnesium chelatase accessory protein
MHWETEGLDWPNRKFSRFVGASGLRWHVQEFPSLADEHKESAPVILLLHGTGSSSHSWREVAPLLAQHARVLVLDLPGHAFTSMPHATEQSLPGMARHVASLLSSLSISPTLVVGHSAGAAVAARMVLDQAITPKALVSLNGALLGFSGLAGQFFSPIARVLASMPLVARFFTWQSADLATVERLIASTGSKLDTRGLQLYAQCVRNEGHVDAALAMMAHWDLQQLQSELHKIKIPLWMVAAHNDLTVPAEQAAQVAKELQFSELVMWPKLGHLAHEEDPTLCVDLIVDVMRKVGVSATASSQAAVV